MLENKRLSYYKSQDMSELKGVLNFDNVSATVEMPDPNQPRFLIKASGTTKVFDLKADDV